MPDQNLSSPPALSLNFQIDPNLIDEFVTLTQDHSALHTDQAFARRSLYRTKVVHGMLPVLFIAGLDPFQESAPAQEMVQLNVKFLKPVFASDRLILQASLKSTNSDIGHATYEFQILHAVSKTIVTTGQWTMKPSSIELSTTQKHNSTPSLVSEKLSEKTFQLSELHKGMSCSLPFSVTSQHLKALHRILTKGTAAPLSEMNRQHPFTVQLLSTSLSSTIAGMCLPGRWATFLDLQFQWHAQLNLNTDLNLTAAVGFKSDPLGVIVNDLSITSPSHPDQKQGVGKMTVKVNPPPLATPTMASLASYHSDVDLQGAVALITGASRGIGAVTAKLLALHGAKVIVNYCHGQEDAQKIVDDIQNAQGEALAVQADVSNLIEVQKMIHVALERFGKIDILINNAVSDARPIPFMDLTWGDIQKEMDVTVKGAFHCCQTVIPTLKKQNNGIIINIGTTYIDNPVPQQTKYVLSKNALLGLTRSLAVDYANQNISVLMLCPRMVATDLSQGGRDLKPKLNAVDVAQKIVEIISQKTTYQSGQTITLS